MPTRSCRSADAGGATRRPGDPATRRPGDPATRRPGDPATRRPGDPATRRPGDPATRRPGDPATRRPGDPATRRPGDPATRRPGDPATRRPGDPATRRPGDPATRRPGDPATRRPGIIVSSPASRASVKRPPAPDIAANAEPIARTARSTAPTVFIASTPDPLPRPPPVWPGGRDILFPRSRSIIRNRFHAQALSARRSTTISLIVDQK